MGAAADPHDDLVGLNDDICGGFGFNEVSEQGCGA